MCILYTYIFTLTAPASGDRRAGREFRCIWQTTRARDPASCVYNYFNIM